MGNMCRNDQLEKYYQTTEEGFSAFLNSGGIMGSLTALEQMFEEFSRMPDFIQYKLYQNVSNFGDQKLATYYYGEHRDLVKLDVHQMVFSTFTLVAPPKYERSSIHKRTCKLQRGGTSGYSHTCRLADWVVRYDLDPTTCFLSRNLNKSLTTAKTVDIFDDRLLVLLEELHSRPVLWHGNGDGKKAFLHYSKKILHCLRNQARVQ